MNPTHMKPSSADILLAIGKVVADNWPDPVVEPLWLCDAYEEGSLAGSGAGHTVNEAMAMAWISVWWDGVLEFESDAVPIDIPGGWTFKFTGFWQFR